jgi:hypothetical protein
LIGVREADHGNAADERLGDGTVVVAIVEVDG